MWIVLCAESEVQAMQDRFRVTNIARDEQTGEVLLRVLSDAESMAQLRTAERPNVVGLAKQVRPTLEDYYLHVFGDASGT